MRSGGPFRQRPSGGFRKEQRDDAIGLDRLGRYADRRLELFRLEGQPG